MRLFREDWNLGTRIDCVSISELEFGYGERQNGKICKIKWATIKGRKRENVTHKNNSTNKNKIFMFIFLFDTESSNCNIFEEKR